MVVLSIAHDRSVWGTTSSRKTLSSTLTLTPRGTAVDKATRCHVIAVT